MPVDQLMSKERAAEHYRRVKTRQLTSMSIFGVDPLAKHANRKFEETPNFHGNSVSKAYFLKFSKKIFWNLGFLFNFFLGCHLCDCKQSFEM